MSTISEVLDRKGTDVATVGPDASVLDAANLMNRRRYGALCVVNDDGLIGIITERDILTRVVSGMRDPADTKVGDVMTAPVITCGLHGETAHCIAVMSHKRIRHLPVVEDGKLAGLVSSGDLMALQVAEKQALIENMYEYLHGQTR